MTSSDRARRLRRITVTAISAAIVAGGVGFGVAHAVGNASSPAQTSVDRPEPGDSPDSADSHESAGQPDIPEPGDTPDAQH